MAQAADSEASSLHKTVESLKQDAQRALVESRQAGQQWAVAQADLRSTRHQLKVLQQQVPPSLQSLLVELVLLQNHSGCQQPGAAIILQLFHMVNRSDLHSVVQHMIAALALYHWEEHFLLLWAIGVCRNL